MCSAPVALHAENGALNSDGFEATIASAYDQYRAQLVTIALHLVHDQEAAEDIVEDVFVAALVKPEITSVVAYLRRAVLNRARNAIRQETARTRPCTFRLDHPATDAECAARATHEREASELVLIILETLPRRCRQIAHAHWIEEKSCSEIARELNISVKGVEKQLSRARRLTRGSDLLMTAGVINGYVTTCQAKSVATALSKAGSHSNSGVCQREIGLVHTEVARTNSHLEKKAKPNALSRWVSLRR